MSRRHRTSSNLSDIIGPDSTRRDARQRRRERAAGAKWLRRFMALGLGLLTILFLLPNLIGWTGMGQRLIDLTAGDVEGRITIDSLRMGWLQTIEVRGLRVVDKEKNQLVDVESLRTNKRLINLLLDETLGTIELTRPRMRWVTRSGGSNLEDVFQAYLEPPAEDTTDQPLPNLNIEVVDGTIELASQLEPNAWTVGSLNMSMALGQQTAGVPTALIASITAQVMRENQSGSLDAKLRVDDKQVELTGDNALLELSADQLALGCLGPVLERLWGRTEIAGLLNGGMNLQFAQTGSGLAVQFNDVNVTDVGFSAPQYLGRDRIDLKKLLASGRAELTPDGVTTRQFHLESDFGRLTTDGRLDWNQLSQMATQNQLLQTPFQLDGQLDLARLSQLLPETLQLYDDLRVESGEMRCQINSRPEQGAGRLVVNLDTANVVAIRNGQRLAWQQPLRLTSTVSQRDGSWSLDEVRCESDFLTLEGQANQKQGRFVARGDLSVLMQRLSQFMDARGWAIQGELDGQLAWKVPQGAAAIGQSLSLVNTPLEFQGDFTVKQPLVALPGFKPWKSSLLTASITGTGKALVNGSAAIDEADANFRLGDERARILLARPIEDLMQSEEYQAKFVLAGRLENWVEHAAVIYDLAFLRSAGQLDARGTLTANARQLDVTDFQYTLENGQLLNYGLQIREPRFTGDGRFRYDLESGVLLIPEVTLTCSSVAARGDNLQIQYVSFLDMQGDIAFRADTHRSLKWMGMSGDADPVHYFGGIEGNLRLVSSPQAISASVQGTIQDFIAAQPVPRRTEADSGWETLLRESAVAYQSRFQLRQDFDQITFDELNIASPSVKIDATGTVEQLTQDLVTNLKGTWSPDWVRVQNLLDAYTWQQVKLAGRQQQAFSIQGPLFSVDPLASWPPADLRCMTKVAWDQGQVFLLPVGPAEVEATLENGTATLRTGEIPFSGGFISMAPRYAMSDPQQRVSLEAGTLASQVALTPEICRDWMKYVAPLVADVTSAEGKVSVETTGMVVPLTDLNAAAGRGTVTLTDVTLGAGPLGKQLISTVEGLRAMLKPNQPADAKDRSVWLRLEQQSVPVAIANGRVHHDGVKIRVKDVTLTTQGSVGFDQTLSMVAEIPILDDWIAGERWLAGLQGQTLKIPISGTLSQPRLDVRAVQQLSMQILQRTAATELNSQTEKLQGKLTGEIEKVQDKLGGEIEKVQTRLNDKVQGELLRGMNNLFGPKKDKDNENDQE